MRKFSKKIAMMMVLAMLVSMFSGIVSASAASVWSAKSVDDDNYAVVMGETIEVKKGEFINFDLFKGDEEATEAGYKYTWESSDADVLFINGAQGAKNGYARVKGEVGEKATISVSFTNLKTGVTVKTPRTFDVVVVEELEADVEEEAEYSIETKVGEVELGEEILYLDTAYTFTSKVFDADDKAVEKAEVKFFIDEKEIKFPYNFAEAGEFVITAVATIEKEEYSYDYAVYVVNNNVFEVEQSSMNSFTMTFAEKKDVSKITKNDIVVTKAASADSQVKVKQFVNTVTPDKDNNAVKVTLYNGFAKDEVLTVEYKKETDTFTARKGTINTIVLNGGKFEYTKPVNLVDCIKIYDEFGIDITAGEDMSKVSLEVVAGGTNAVFNAGAKTLTFWIDGKEISLKAVYHTRTWKDGKEITFTSEPATYVSVKESSAYAGIDAWAVTTKTNKNDIVWSGENRVALGDSSYYVIGRLNKTVTVVNATTSVTTTYDERANLTFSSTDPSVALVDNNGKLIAINKGYTDIIVKQKDTVLGVFTIEVVDGRKANAMTYSTNKAAVISAADDIEIKLAIYDQYGAEFKTSDLEIKKLANPNAFVNAKIEENKIVVFGNAVTIPAGANQATEQFEIKVKNTNVVVYFDLTVKKNDGGAVNYAFDQDSITIDTTLAKNDQKTFEELFADKEIKVLGYDKNWMLTDKDPVAIAGLNPTGVGSVNTGLTAGDLYVEIKAVANNNTWLANGKHVALAATGTVVTFDYMDVDNDVVTKATAGNYNVNLYKVVAVDNKGNFAYELCDNLVITVKDAQAGYSAEAIKNSTNQVAANVIAVSGTAFETAVAEVFKVTQNGNAVAVEINVPTANKTDFVVGYDKTIVFKKINVKSAFEFKNGTKYFNQDITLPNTPITGK